MLNIGNIVSKVKEAIKKPPEIVQKTVTAKQEAQKAKETDSIMRSNYASTTVVINNRDIDELNQANKGLSAIKLSAKEAENMSVLISKNYPDLSPEEEASAARAILDNNRQLMDSVNETYLADQITQDVLSYNLSEEEQELVFGIIGDTVLSGSEFDEDDYKNASDAVRNAVRQVESRYNAQPDSGVEPYKQYSQDARVDEIPVEYILNSDYSEYMGDYVYLPDLSTFKLADGSTESFTGDIVFESEEDTKAIPFDEILALESEEEQLKALEASIAENYGLEGLDNVAGKAILHAIGLEEGNNAIFDKNNENLDEYLPLILQYAKDSVSNGETPEIYFPDVNISVMSDGKLSQKAAREYLIKNDTDDEVSYLHVKEDSVNTSELPEDATASELLKFVGYDVDKNGESINLFDALEASKGTPEYQAMKALAATAVTQLIESNPDLYNSELYQSYLENPKGYTINDILNFPIAEVLGDSATVQLENISYINSAPAKVVKPAGTTPPPMTTPEPTADPTATPSATPSADPTATPSADPTATPSADPTAAPSADPTATPSADPTATPSADPTATPSADPTATPSTTPESTVEPTAEPETTVEPTAEPETTVEPTAEPETTVEPTAEPETTVEPTESSEPTTCPTEPPVEQRPTTPPDGETDIDSSDPNGADDYEASFDSATTNQSAETKQAEAQVAAQEAEAKEAEAQEAVEDAEQTATQATVETAQKATQEASDAQVAAQEAKKEAQEAEKNAADDEEVDF